MDSSSTIKFDKSEKENTAVNSIRGLYSPLQIYRNMVRPHMKVEDSTVNDCENALAEASARCRFPLELLLFLNSGVPFLGL